MEKFSVKRMIGFCGAYAICFAIWFAAKTYVKKYCQDNEPIVWIWLDDEPENGARANATNKFQFMRLALSGSAC